MSFSLRSFVSKILFFRRERNDAPGVDSLSLEESVREFMTNHPNETITGEVMKEIIEKAKTRR